MPAAPASMSPPPPAPMFPDDAVVRRVDGEAVLLLGGGRALLMQLAHPMIARGVAEHSDFRANPLRRLRRTLDATYTVVFGSQEQAQRVRSAVGAVHATVVGDGYRADDPALLLWVHATLVDTALRVYRRFVGSVSAADEARYYEESKQIGEMFGLPLSAQPDTFEEFRVYVRSTVAALEVTDVARRMARAVLQPRLPTLARPAGELFRQVTAGLLPPPLREQYGLGWDVVRAHTLGVSGFGSRLVLAHVPAALRRVGT